MKFFLFVVASTSVLMSCVSVKKEIKNDFSKSLPLLAPQLLDTEVIASHYVDNSKIVIVVHPQCDFSVNAIYRF